MRLIKIIALVCASVLAVNVSQASDFSKLPDKKKTKLGLYMTPKDAYDFLQKNADKTLFVDIRTRAEVNFLGTPSMIDANVPYMEMNEWWSWNEKKNGFKLEVNSDFADEIAARLEAKGLTKNDAIIVMCRSGDRSAKAADLLASLGYTKVYSIVEGFEGDMAKSGENAGRRAVNGWKNAGLPWSYKLAKEKMYHVGG